MAGITACVRQLLELDAQAQLDTLDSLSKYSGNQLSNAPVSQETPQKSHLLSSTPPGAFAIAAPKNAQVTPPPGLSGFDASPASPLAQPQFVYPSWAKDETGGAAAQYAMHESSADRVQTDLPWPQPFVEQSAGVHRGQGSPPAWSSNGALDRAIFDLIAHLSPEAASHAAEVLANVCNVYGGGGAAAAAAAAAGGKGPGSALWLTQMLERHQAQSAEKVQRMMQARASGPMDVPTGKAPHTPKTPKQKAARGQEKPTLLNRSAHEFKPACFAAPKTANGTADGRVPFQGPVPPRPTEGAQRAASQEPFTPVDTLRLHLQQLLSIDPACVLLVRKINRLGFSSAAALEQHYSWYGQVDNILVAHSRAKAYVAQSNSLRIRPAGLGFIVMRRAEDVQRILMDGPEQVVQGVVVRVQQFERRIAIPDDEEEPLCTPTHSCSSASGSTRAVSKAHSSTGSDSS